MDPQIDELKELMRQNIAISTDTNRIMHRMHRMQRSIRWARFFRVLWVVVVFGVVAGGYYFYVQPYLEKIIATYESAQAGVTQAQSLQSEAFDMIKSFLSKIPTFSVPASQ